MEVNTSKTKISKPSKDFAEVVAWLKTQDKETQEKAYDLLFKLTAWEE